MEDLDFLDEIGECAYYSDEENRRIEDETPDDLWQEELNEIWEEDV